jgi:hypothetical protein
MFGYHLAFLTQHNAASTKSSSCGDRRDLALIQAESGHLKPVTPQKELSPEDDVGSFNRPLLSSLPLSGINRKNGNTGQR